MIYKNAQDYNSFENNCNFHMVIVMQFLQVNSEKIVKIIKEQTEFKKNYFIENFWKENLH